MTHDGHTYCPVLKQGSSGAAVRDLQHHLAGAGFNPGKIDGIFGSNTKSAVLAFQQSANLVQDGIVGNKTWAALGANCHRPHHHHCPTLVQGNTGEVVIKLQRHLKSNGYYKGNLDGIFGSHTRAAVIAFQGSANLVQDGIVGSKTWTALGVYCH